jgi:multisubunit Na+/H+ antiporter MnhG subunit
MQGTLIAIILLVQPLLLVVLLRTSAAMLFLVFAGSALLQHNLDKDVAGFANSLLGGSTSNTQLLSLLLLLVPFFVTAVAFKDSVTKAGTVGHGLLSIGVGLCVLFVVTPYLPANSFAAVNGSPLYIAVLPFTSLAIATALLGSVLVLWFGRKKHEHNKHKKHGH